MATTPAADNLDERISKILSMADWTADGQITWEEGRKDKEIAIESIKQAFKDAGYMTGQEWYDKFQVELLKRDKSVTVTSVHEVPALLEELEQWVDIAAKRASGIKE